MEDGDGTWEYVMLQQGKAKEEDDNEDEQDDDEEEEEGDLDEEPLDMPPPWSPKLFVNRDKFTDKTPGGEKTVFKSNRGICLQDHTNKPDHKL